MTIFKQSVQYDVNYKCYFHPKYSQFLQKMSASISCTPAGYAGPQGLHHVYGPQWTEIYVFWPIFTPNEHCQHLATAHEKQLAEVQGDPRELTKKYELIARTKKHHWC